MGLSGLKSLRMEAPEDTVAPFVQTLLITLYLSYMYTVVALTLHNY